MPSIPRAVTLTALLPPSLGVSSLDLGRWHASGLFLCTLRHIAAGAAAPEQRRLAAVEQCSLPTRCAATCENCIAATGILRLNFLRCGEIFLRCGNACCRRPVVGVSSLDLGHWLASDPFSLPGRRANYGTWSRYREGSILATERRSRLAFDVVSVDNYKHGSDEPQSPLL